MLAAHPAVREINQHLLLLLTVLNMCHVNGGKVCSSLPVNHTVSTMHDCHVWAHEVGSFPQSCLCLLRLDDSGIAGTLSTCSARVRAPSIVDLEHQT